MKLLLAGDWRYDWYEAACAEALRRLGVEVIRGAAFLRVVDGRRLDLTLYNSNGGPNFVIGREIQACRGFDEMPELVRHHPGNQKEAARGCHTPPPTPHQRAPLRYQFIGIADAAYMFAAHG
jgi:hypothetical protein